MQFLDRTGVGTLWSMCKTKFALAGHTHNSLAAVGNEQISATAYGSGLHFKPYYSSGGPTTYGNILEYTSTNTGGGQLAMEWTGSQTESNGTDSNVGRVYYRSKRDCINGWTKWMTLAYTNDIPTKLSQLTNDKGFVTGSVSGNTVTINGASTTWTNTWRPIQDNLTSTSTSESLSANQGRVLKGLVDGKANSSHTHNYLPLSGGTLTGDLLFSNSGTAFRQIRGTCGDNDFWRIGGGATGNNAGYMEIATADDGTEPIYVRQYSGTFGAITRTATLLDGDGNTSFPGTVAAAKFKGALEGNASTASNASTVNGHTVNANVPANAKFTDTNTWRGIQDNLTSTSTSESLSANQGRVLKGLVDSKVNSSDLSSYSQKSDTIKSIRFEKNGYTQGNSKFVQVLHVFKANGEDDYLQMYNAASNINGLMSYQDKIKLDGIASGANNYSLPVASQNTLGGILSSPISGTNTSLWPITVTAQAIACTNINGLMRSPSGSIASIFIESGDYTTNYTATTIRKENVAQNKAAVLDIPSKSGTLALTSDIPDVSNLCKFNFINSISECKSNRINFLFRFTEYDIDLSDFDNYPDGTILLISVANNSVSIRHQSGRWFYEGDEVSANNTTYIYKEGIKLITKYVGKIHYYSL